ncbi:polyphosphate kinase 2 [Frigoribacterium sp. UYMn621]|jgi:polyphosphate kinase 2|uniref:polyphosphate kinase 2 n=1 Tax=Frigoribacterium sp. UYMn621 TaxID=3156343 RepID=UPI003394C845
MSPKKTDSDRRKLSKRAYEAELERLQVELVQMQQWVVQSGARLLVIFEGRDAAGKGGSIKRVIQYLNPRSARVAALPAPSERERGQWYFQRYIERLPAAGEIVLMDRSWYNRAGVERVLGYCTDEEYERFLKQVPVLERLLVEDGIILVKYWFSVSDEEQQKRFKSRLNDPMRRWKLSETDLKSIVEWESYSRAKDAMFKVTDIPEAPWWTIESDDKKSARLNAISHLLTQIPWDAIEPESIELPDRPTADGYERPARELYKYVPNHAARLSS